MGILDSATKIEKQPEGLGFILKIGNTGETTYEDRWMILYNRFYLEQELVLALITVFLSRARFRRTS